MSRLLAIDSCQQTRLFAKRRCLSITKTTMSRSLVCLPYSNITDYNFTGHSAYSFHAVASISGKVLDELLICAG